MPKFFSIVLIDREPILAQWRDRCSRLIEELSEILKNTQSFQEEAVPAYRAWVSREFGAELTALRELQESLTKLEAIHHATETEASLRGKGYPAAYQAVMARRRAGEDLFPPDFDTVQDEDWEEGWDEVDPFVDYRAEREENPPLFEEVSQPVAEVFTEDPEIEQVRTLYRKLAFALHPDVNPDQTRRHRELWSEVQEAYESRDLTRLEVLYSLTETGDKSDFLHITQVSTLQALFEDQRHELRVTSAAFHKLKKDPAWKYWKASENGDTFTYLRAEIESEIVTEFLKVRRKIDHHESLFRKWATGTSRKR